MTRLRTMNGTMDGRMRGTVGMAAMTMAVVVASMAGVTAAQEPAKRPVATSAPAGAVRAVSQSVTVETPAPGAPGGMPLVMPGVAPGSRGPGAGAVGAGAAAGAPGGLGSVGAVPMPMPAGVPGGFAPGVPSGFSTGAPAGLPPVIAGWPGAEAGLAPGMAMPARKPDFPPPPFPPDFPGRRPVDASRAAEPAGFLPPAGLAPAGATSPTIVRAGGGVPARPEMLPETPLAMKVPEAARGTLSNGVKFFHYRSADLPRVQVVALVRAGEHLSPAGKVGLAGMTARGMRAAGAGGRSPDDLDRDLERMGGELDISADREQAVIQLFSLTPRLAEGMALMADCMLRPDFDAARLDKERELALEDVRRENDDPATMARREFRKLIYGDAHPLARTATAASLKAVSRDDVRAFHAAWYRPSSLFVGMAGDIGFDEAKALAEKAFGGWKAPAAVVPPIPEPDEARDAGTTGVTIIRRQTAQSQIRMGHLGVPRRSPDRFAIGVANNVYGTGGFTSRLMNAVRTKQGFVYGVSGGVQSDAPRGLFAAGAASKAKTTAAAIREILATTDLFLKDGLTEEELETAKRDAVFSFFTGFDTPREIVERTMMYDFQGEAEDFARTYPEKTRAVTAAEALAAARKHIKPARMKVLVVGFEKAFDKPLSTFGPVTERKLDEAKP